MIPISKKLSPDTKIAGLNNTTVCDFWSWAYSIILENITRSAFAEFIVGSILDVVKTPREVWNSVDFHYRGRGMEVKSAAYLQNWKQNKSSKIVFDIGKKHPWIRETNIMEKEKVRSADFYVFCLYTEDDIDKLKKFPESILDVNSWQFFVLSTEKINKNFTEQKSITLGRLKEICEPITHYRLKQFIDSILE